MGAAHAELLVSEGARVVIGDVFDEPGRAVAEKLGGAGRFVHLDVTDAEQWAAAIEACRGEFGRLDALVNNAGIVRLDSVLRPSLVDWQSVLDGGLTCGVPAPI